MKRLKIECEFGLPELAIERIQSFLPSEEAARTTLLSQSWRRAWLTRPNLDFVFSGKHQRARDSFMESVDETLKRYEDSNRKIQSFKIRMKRGSHRVSDFIARASKIGATHISVGFRDRSFVLSAEVLFGSENLVSLTAKGCRINSGVLNQNVTRPMLQSLCLDSVDIESLGVISHIFSSCPSIRNLSVSNVCEVKHYDTDDDFADFPVLGDGEDGFAVVAVIGDAPTPVTMSNLHRLRSLVLGSVTFDTSFLGDLSSKIPSLKDLTLKMDHTRYTGELNEMLISSSSLECLRLDIYKFSLKFKFDVPSIRKFTFHGSTVPSLSFSESTTNSKGGWESSVSITLDAHLKTSWFRGLSKLLTKLRPSRIHLSLLVYSSRMRFDYKVEDIQGLPTHVIENLALNFEFLPTLSWCALLDGFFLMCRPKFMTPSHGTIDFVGQTFLQRLVANFSTPNSFMYGLKDLKEVRPQIFDEAVSTWRDAPLDAIKSSIGKQGIRYQMNWKLQAAAYQLLLDIPYKLKHCDFVGHVRNFFQF